MLRWFSADPPVGNSLLWDDALLNAAIIVLLNLVRLNAARRPPDARWTPRTSRPPATNESHRNAPLLSVPRPANGGCPLHRFSLNDTRPREEAGPLIEGFMAAILSTLVPVFLLIALGAILQRGRFFAEGVVGGLNRLTYWVGLPTLVFVSLATAESGAGHVGGLLIAMLLTTLAVVALAGLLGKRMGVLPVDRGTFIQAGFRGNLAFVGLPVVMVLPGTSPAMAVLVIAPMILVYNVLAVIALSMSRHGAGVGVGRIVLREVVRNPIIWASIAGGLWYLNAWPVWAPLLTGLTQLARMAVPLALLCIGTALVSTPLRGAGSRVLATAILKAVVSPLLAWAIGSGLGLDTGALRLLMVLTACPTASVSFTMVLELGGDQVLAARSIVASALLSAVTLAVIVALT